MPKPTKKTSSSNRAKSGDRPDQDPLFPAQLGSDLDQNYERFFAEALAMGCLWSLEGGEGFALCESNQTASVAVIPFWSQPEFAKMHCVDDWQGYEVVPVALDEFLDDWLPGMHEDVHLVGMNWNAELEGDEIEPLDLLEEFDRRIAS